ncbi:hypothetical protein [Endozoicomonas sp. SESOKO3]|uniref:hypothetical protein n=1 Tax=Endozoicomonas sp. SESOKO3 TaxID=2828744 RepID=UPI002147FEB1|nr:hypothetical protein [Endozoicomonas sp. SESOKO3]
MPVFVSPAALPSGTMLIDAEEFQQNLHLLHRLKCIKVTAGKLAGNANADTTFNWFSAPDQILINTVNPR